MEKLAQAAAAGKLRGKRRDGRVGFADSDSESEDEDDRMRRKAMAKKRRIDGDGLDTLGERFSTTRILQLRSENFPQPKIPRRVLSMITTKRICTAGATRSTKILAETKPYPKMNPRLSTFAKYEASF